MTTCENNYCKAEATTVFHGKHYCDYCARLRQRAAELWPGVPEEKDGGDTE